MSSLKEIKKRIQTAKSSSQLTKAMELISATRLKKVQHDLDAFDPFFEQLSTLLEVVWLENLQRDSQYHPKLEKLLATPDVPREEAGAHGTLVLLISSDRGLCGGYNSKLVQAANRFYKMHEGSMFLCLGTKGFNGSHDIPSERKVRLRHLNGRELTYEKFCDYFMPTLSQMVTANHASDVTIISNSTTINKQEIVIESLWHTNPRTLLTDGNWQRQAGMHGLYMFEPSLHSLSSDIMLAYIRARLYHVLLRSMLSEHHARMLAMENATRNARKIADSMKRLYNQTRQASVTRELIEVVSGMEAVQNA